MDKIWRMARVGTVLAALLAAACHASPESHFAPLTETVESAHFVYHYAAGDRPSFDFAWQDAHHAWVLAQLGIAPTPKLDYYKCMSRAHLKALTGRDTNGFAVLGSWGFFTTWRFDGHESVHVVVMQGIGTPPALFNEGIAVALSAEPIHGPGVFVPSPTWSGVPIDDIVRGLRSAGLPDVTKIVETNAFFAYPEEMIYPVAGSFVAYLLRVEGAEKLKALAASAGFLDPRDVTEQRFLAVYGKPLAQAWQEWQARL